MAKKADAPPTGFRSAATFIDQDWVSLGAWLAYQDMFLDEDVPVRQFSGGVANLNYLVSIDGKPAVLRRPPSGPSAEGANDMARETRVLNGLRGHLPLAPASLAFCDDVSVLGAPFQVLEYRAGRSIGATVPPEFAGPGAGTHLTSQLISAMTSLHAVDVAATPLAELGRPEGFLGRQVEGWARRSAAAFEAVDEPEPTAVATVLEALRDDVPDSPRVALLHCDLKFDNLLFDEESGRPVALIDWDMATRGDPLFDLAVLLSYWVQPGDPDDVHALRQVPSLQPGFPRRTDVAARYAAASGHSVDDLEFHVTLARFRLAVAWQQLYVQYRRGSLVDPRYADFGRLARAVLDWTAETVHSPLDD